jgi:hypothetical protein
MLRVFFSIIILLYIVPTVSAQEDYQEGYIVSNRGDTTHGFIAVGNFFKDQRNILFFDAYGVLATYTSDRISAFGYKDKEYVSKKTPYLFSGLFSDSTLFMIRLVNGPAKLYRYYTRRSAFTLQKGPAYFDIIEKPNGKEFEVSYNFKWKRMADAFADHPSLSREIANDLFKMEETERIVREYNKWYYEQLNER